MGVHTYEVWVKFTPARGWANMGTVHAENYDGAWEAFCRDKGFAIDRSITNQHKVCRRQGLNSRIYRLHATVRRVQ